MTIKSHMRHHPVVGVPPGNKLVVMGQSFLRKGLKLHFVFLVLMKVVRVPHGAGGKEVPMVARPFLDLPPLSLPTWR